MDDEKMTGRELLEGLLFKESENIQDLEVGSKERQQSINAFGDLYKEYIEDLHEADSFYNAEEDRKLRADLEQQKIDLEKQKMEVELQKIEQQKKSDNKKLYLEIGKAVIGIGAWIGMSLKVMKFEETGTIRSKAWSGTMPKWKFW